MDRIKLNLINTKQNIYKLFLRLLTFNRNFHDPVSVRIDRFVTYGNVDVADEFKLLFIHVILRFNLIENLQEFNFLYTHIYIFSKMGDVNNNVKLKLSNKKLQKVRSNNKPLIINDRKDSNATERKRMDSHSTANRDDCDVISKGNGEYYVRAIL